VKREGLVIHKGYTVRWKADSQQSAVDSLQSRVGSHIENRWSKQHLKFNIQNNSLRKPLLLPPYALMVFFRFFFKLNAKLYVKRFLLWPVICMISAFSLHGQKTLPFFGQPIREELEMKTCSFEPAANAMKLLDYQEKELIIDFGFKMKTTRRVKIKIFNPRGFQHANISIPYISRIKGTKLSDINAYIHYQDAQGNIITEKVDKNQIFRNNQNNAFKKISFTFPNLKAGAVIEYQYELTEKNSLYLDPWFFQDIIPTRLSLFKLTIPYNIRVENRLMGVDSIIVNTKEEGGGAFYAPSLVRESIHFCMSLPSRLKK
jgi:Domain of Unknown Function with PDB structure (DUF3857)